MNAKQLNLFTPDKINRTPVHAIFAGDTVYVTTKQDYAHYRPLRAQGVRVLWVDQDAILQVCPKPPTPEPVIKLLPAPKIAGLLPANVPSSVNIYGEYIGTTVSVPGFSIDCTITRVFDRWDDTWVTVKTTKGKHTLIATRKLSQLIPNLED